MSFLESVGSWFLENEMVAILLSLCLGHLIGKINFGRFTLGSTVGTLLVAMIIGQSGTFSISSTAQMLFFMLCVFAIGYESGPAFVKGFKNAGMRVIGLSLFFVVVGTGLTVGLCKACGLDAGTSAGIFAGSLTQTAVIGTAGDAIASLGLDEATTAALQSNVSISYALTYFFGMAGVIVLIQRVEPAILRVDLKRAALEKAAAMGYKEEAESDGSIVEKQKETDVSFVTFGIIVGLIIGGISIKAGYISSRNHRVSSPLIPAVALSIAITVIPLPPRSHNLRRRLCCFPGCPTAAPHSAHYHGSQSPSHSEARLYLSVYATAVLRLQNALCIGVAQPLTNRPSASAQY